MGRQLVSAHVYGGCPIAWASRYVDYPITDVLQMMGRAGRPQFDTNAKAVIMVHEPKRGFYKKFLYEPFPVESALHDQITDHFNAEIVNGTICKAQDAVDYLTWTYFYRRLAQNPAYYDLAGVGHEQVSAHLSEMVEAAFGRLEDASCITIDQGGEVEATMAGRVASFYYLRHQTMSLFMKTMHEQMDFKSLLRLLSNASEYDELPVRHNEDKLNAALSDTVRWSVSHSLCDQPHVKAYLLMQAHFSHLPLPIADYVTDTKTVLDNSIRLLQAMIDVVADQGWLSNTLATIHILQSIVQACWADEPSASVLPHLDSDRARALASRDYRCLGDLVQAAYSASTSSSADDGEGATNGRGRRGGRGRGPGAGRGRSSTSRGGKGGTLHADLCNSADLNASEASDVMAVLLRMPLVSMRASAPVRRSVAADGEDNEAEASEQYELELTLRREAGPTSSSGRGGDRSRAGQRARVYSPRFPKVKEEGWFLVLADERSGELLALKRLGVPAHRVTSTKLLFPVDDIDGEPLQSVTVFLLSDSYLGLDQDGVIPLGSSVKEKGRTPLGRFRRQALTLPT